MTDLVRELKAVVVENADGDGPYYEIRMMDVLLAYSDSRANAELISSALNTSNAFTVIKLAAEGGDDVKQ